MNKIKVGINDLATTNVELLKEWNYEKNAIKPIEISKGSNKKVWWICARNHEWKESSANRINGRGCPFCSNHQVLEGYNDLKTTSPELAKEWNYEKNTIKPTEITKGSNKKVWWKCPLGHEWEAIVCSRSRGGGCPICAGKQCLEGFNDLGTTHPNLIEEWNYEKNTIKPIEITKGNTIKVWWKCKEGHEWQATVNNRTNNKRGCPYCVNQKVLAGYNDLATTNPELLNEWNYVKNDKLGINPIEISAGSNIKVWWKCKKEHEWEASISARVGKSKTGCPICAKEKQSSFPEQAIFYYIKKVFPDAINGDRRQIAPYELDIYIPSKKVAIEYDGQFWHKSTKKDVLKNQKCKEMGIILYRIREEECPVINEEIERNFYYKHNDYNVLNEIIEKVITKLDVAYQIDIDIVRDTSHILKQYLSKDKEESLANRYPELLVEWDYEKNKISPMEVLAGSGKKVWWKCKEGHEWQCTPNARTCKKSGCPYCSNQKLLIGYNDLATRYPELMEEWNNVKNVIKPKEITYGSNQKVWWKCKQGHEWQAIIVNRTRLGAGCPICAGENGAKTRLIKKIKKEGNLALTNPELIHEWNYEKNEVLEIKPTEVTKSSGKKVWWKCKNGHEWKAQISNRSRGMGCPYCSGRLAITGENDLATTHGYLVEEWNFEKNDILRISPNNIKAGSNKEVWWKCNSGHEWKAKICDKTKGKGCPYCE